MTNSSVETIFFWILAIVSVLSALGVVFEKRLLRSAVALMVLLVASAGFSILLGFEFIAGIQILVFVGGIVVLMIFAIMMTSEGNAFERKPTGGRKAVAFVTSTVFFVVVSWVLTATDWAVVEASDGGVDEAASSVEAIGKTLLSNEAGGYVITFELVSLLLLAALIGGIVVARKREEGQGSEA